jgi:hypothetical protein
MTAASSGSDMLGKAQVEVLLVSVGDGLQNVRDHPFRAGAAVDSVVVDGQAERGDGADIPPERQVVVDRDTEDVREPRGMPTWVVSCAPAPTSSSAPSPTG